MPQLWSHSEAVVAQRLSRGQLAGFFRKQILLKPNEQAILEKDGQIVKKLSAGKHTISNLFDRSLKEIILIDDSLKSMKREVKDLWTGDDKKIDSELELQFKVTASDKLFTNLLKEKSMLTLDDIWSKLYTELVAKVLTPEVKKRSIDELYGNRELLERIKASIEVELRKRLELYGIELVSFALLWRFPPEYEAYLKARGLRKEEAEVREWEAKEKLKAIAKEREALALKPREEETREKVLEELEKERLKREFELEMEKKETQRDIEDALEALRLKEIKDKQKILTLAKRKKLGLPLPLKQELKLKTANIEEIDDLRKRYRELQQMKEATEKNYYKKRIDEETFKRLMQEYEQKLIEIEVKLKNLKERLK